MYVATLLTAHVSRATLAIVAVSCRPTPYRMVSSQPL